MRKIHNEQLINFINKEKICDKAVLSHIEPRNKREKSNMDPVFIYSVAILLMMGKSFLTLGSAPERLSIKVFTASAVWESSPQMSQCRVVFFFPSTLPAKGLTFKFSEMTPWTPDLKTGLNCDVF